MPPTTARPSRCGNAASASPAPPTAARAASCRPIGASAATATLVSRSAALVVARAASTLSPIDNTLQPGGPRHQRRPQRVHRRERLQRRRRRGHHRVQPPGQPPRLIRPGHLTKHAAQPSHLHASRSRDQATSLYVSRVTCPHPEGMNVARRSRCHMVASTGWVPPVTVSSPSRMGSPQLAQTVGVEVGAAAVLEDDGLGAGVAVAAPHPAGRYCMSDSPC